MTPSPYADRPNRPVFVGGCPRSGTTLMRSMLNAHPDLAVPHESRFVIPAYRRRRAWGELSARETREQIARWVIADERSRWRRLVDDPEALVEAMVAAPPTLGSILSSGFLLYAERHGKRRWGDKRPSYVRNLDAVFAMFPDAQFINVVRDPRAAVASIRRVEIVEDGLVAGTEWWERSQRDAGRWSRRLAPDQFLEVRYERLATDPVAVLGDVIAFLGLDPAGLERMLAYHEDVDIKSRRMHPLVRRPVTTATLRTFETELEPHEIAFIEQALAEPMRRHGYEPLDTGAAIPADLRRRRRRHRAAVRRMLGRRWVVEHGMRFAYRQPVAAVPREPRPVSPAPARSGS